MPSNMQELKNVVFWLTTGIAFLIPHGHSFFLDSRRHISRSHGDPLIRIPLETFSKAKDDEDVAALFKNDIFFFQDSKQQDSEEVFAVHGREAKQTMQQQGWKELKVNYFSLARLVKVKSAS